MKTVFTSREIDHIWVHKQAPRGRACNESFDGDVLKSYSTDIGRHISHRGKNAIILNDTSYSMTTSKHQSALRRAIPAGTETFRVSGLGYGAVLSGDKRQLAKLVYDKCIESATAARADSMRPRIQQARKDRCAAQEHRALLDVARVSAFFGLRRKVNTRSIDRLANAAHRAQIREQKEEKQRQVRLAQEAAEKITKWIAGEQVYFPGGLAKIYLRRVGDEMQTSRDVHVPIAEARAAFIFARSKRETGWRRNGEKFAIGGYQLDSVTADGVVAGCHRIGWEEIERFATQQGWTK